MQVLDFSAATSGLKLNDMPAQVLVDNGCSKVFKESDGIRAALKRQ